MVALAGQVDPVESLAIDLGQLGGEWSQATSEVTDRRIGPVVDRFRLWPQIAELVERIVRVTGAVVVDHGVASRAVEPRRRIVDTIESSGGDVANEHILGDVGGDVVIADADRDEGSKPLERLVPAGVGLLSGRPVLVDVHGCAPHINRTDERTPAGTQAGDRVRPRRSSFVFRADRRERPGDDTGSTSG